MLIKGKYTTAQVYTTKNVETAIEDYAASQIQALCDQPINEGCQIAVMPDVHAGIVGTIGYTQTVGKAIMPNVVGIDIGCGMTLARTKIPIIPIGTKSFILRNMEEIFKNF